MEVGGTAVSSAGLRSDAEEQVLVRRKTLQEVLVQCQRALELLNDAEPNPDAALEVDGGEGDEAEAGEPCGADNETDKLCELIKSKVDSPAFLEKFGSIHMSVSHKTYDNSASWDIISANDLWEDEHVDVENEADQDDYVLVSQDDIVDGIACFMAAYLLSLKETKEISPNQLQEALSKTFSVKKKKSKLRKAWDGSQVIYNVASWGATAIGLYQNPAIIKAASLGFWSSCRVISKLF